MAKAVILNFAIQNYECNEGSHLDDIFIGSTTYLFKLFLQENKKKQLDMIDDQ